MEKKHFFAKKKKEKKKGALFNRFYTKIYLFSNDYCKLFLI